MMAPRTVLKNVRELIIFSIVFVIVFKAVEGYTFLENSQGRISSPRFPHSYPHNYYEVWKIRVPSEYRIKLVFDSFNLEFCNNCSCDYVAIYDKSIGSSLLGKFCGSVKRAFIPTTHAMDIEFKTDHSNYEQGFRVTYTTEPNIQATILQETGSNLTQNFMNSRQQTNNINKWGMDVARTAVALFLRNPYFFDKEMNTGKEISYELTLQLKSKLVMKKPISTKDLALFVNAMTVSCMNPQKFFGLNIVAELRKRIDNNNLTNPFFFLSLCIAGENMTMEDVLKLQQIFDAHLRPSWTGTQAMVVMALKCISRKSQINLNTTLEEMVSKLKGKQQNNGAIDNLKTTALVIQALVATDSFLTNFKLTMAIEYILKSMENTHLSSEEMYYILPIIRWKNLLDISSSHCGTFIETELEEMKNVVRKHPDEQIEVQVSVIIGDDMDFTRTWRIKIPSNYSLYQALENISFSASQIKVQYTILGGKPYISGLANYQDSIEDGLFWFIYSKPLSSNDNPVLVEESPVDIRVSNTDELILWYRSEPWPIIQEIATDAPSSNTPSTDSIEEPSTVADDELSTAVDD